MDQQSTVAERPGRYPTAEASARIHSLKSFIRGLLVGFMSTASARMRTGRTVSLGYDKVRFVAPMRFGDTITTEYTITSVDLTKRRTYSDVKCRNQRGEVAASAIHLRAFVD